MNGFDPKALGAIPTGFNAQSLGAVPATEISPPSKINEPPGGLLDWKHPLNVPSAGITPENQKIVGDAIQSIFPGSKLGEAVGNSLIGLSDLIKGDYKGFEQLANENGQNVGKVAGDIASIVGTLGTLVVPAGGSLLKTAASLAGTSALAGGGEAAKSGGNIGDIAKAATISGTVGASLPIVGKGIGYATNVGGRLLSSLASGLSGASQKAINEIISNPSIASDVAKSIDLGNESSILKDNSQKILDGISNIRKEARAQFGQAVGQLKQEDINPKTFRDSISSFLDKYGVSTNQNRTRSFSNVEFSDPTSIKKANSLIDNLSSTNLDGFSLRNLLNKIDNSTYKIANSDERLSYNAFARDMNDSVKNAINGSTDKLKAINQQYSTDMQLADAIQGIFGKVKFKNLNELRKVSEKMDTLFSKKGLSPDIIDSFLTRVGINPSDFKTSEAVRQISSETNPSNTPGLSPSELIRGVTSSIISPKTIRDLTILTGKSQQVLQPFLEGLPVATRLSVIRALAEGQNSSSSQ